MGCGCKNGAAVPPQTQQQTQAQQQQNQTVQNQVKETIEKYYGFEHHIQDHNIASYFCYIFYLKAKEFQW
jgi:hypothetical protein